MDVDRLRSPGPATINAWTVIGTQKKFRMRLPRQDGLRSFEFRRRAHHVDRWSVNNPTWTRPPCTLK